MSRMISEYVRNNKNQKVGYLCATKTGNSLNIGWAFWNKKKDAYDKERMKDVAFGRMKKYALPVNQLHDILESDRINNYWGKDLCFSVMKEYFCDEAFECRLPLGKFPAMYTFISRAFRYFTKNGLKVKTPTE